MEPGCNSGAFIALIAYMVWQLERKLSMPENRDIKNARLFEVALMDCRSKIAIWT